MQKAFAGFLSICFFVIAGAVVGIPAGAACAAPTDTQLAQGIVPCSGIDCQACDLVNLAENIIEFLVLIFSSIAALLFAYAGFKYITAQGSPTQISEAHTIFWNTIMGLILVLAAWLIVDTLIKYLVADSFLASFGPWNDIPCE